MCAPEFQLGPLDLGVGGEVALTNRERVIADITRYAYDYFVLNYGKP